MSSSSRDHAPTASGVVLTVAEARALLDAAESAQQAVNAEIAAEVTVATEAIKRRHAAETRAALDAVILARKELQKAKDATPDHPWTGRKVSKMRRKPGQYLWTRDPKMERVEGVVETVRSHTEFPENTSLYSRPRIGQVIVRLLTKSGKPGLRFETMGGDHHGWQLADADTSERQAKPRDEQS